MARARVVELSEDERAALSGWARAGKTERRLADRARIILAAAEGQPTREIARMMNTRPARVSKWRTRFLQDRLKGLQDGARSGAPVHYDEQTERRILAVLDQAPPGAQATWTGGLVAERLGNVSADQVWRVLRTATVITGRCHMKPI